LLAGRSQSGLLSRYRRALQAIESRLTLYSASSRLFVLGSFFPAENRIEPKMDRTACSMAGQIALSATLGARIDSKSAWSPQECLDLAFAQHLEETCWRMFASSPVGLSPEAVWFWRSQPVASLGQQLSARSCCHLRQRARPDR